MSDSPESSDASVRAFRNFCWGTLAFVVAVILWGALVRATGSGAGCGSHWPTCNGEILPQAMGQKTAIELIHRVTSGLSALLVLAQLLWAWRLYPRQHPVRGAAMASAGFMLVEVAIGAGIVLLRYVDDNASVARALWMAVHLVNTFLLLGALTLCAHHAGGGARWRARGHGVLGWLALASIVGTLLVGASGAVAALGDTLFPPESLGTALAADLSPTAHVLVRLRVIHPFLAVGVALLLLLTRFAFVTKRTGRRLTRWGTAVRVLILTQLCAGLVNMLLLAPIWLQIVHLLLADLLWVALVMLLAYGLADVAERDSESAPGDDLAEPDRWAA